MKAWLRLTLLGLGVAAALSCTDARRYARAVCILVDVSGTYADQRPEVVGIIKRGLLPKIRPGDSVILIRIDSESYEKDNVEVMVTLDSQPSHANAQKLALAKKLEEFGQRPMQSRFTDIRGALLLASDYLRETGAGKKTLVVFSDMKEELPRGARRELGAHELDGVRVVAMNVKKLKSDNVDPAVYRQRLDGWQKRLLAAGASEWKVLLDAENLIEYVNQDL